MSADNRPATATPVSEWLRSTSNRTFVAVPLALLAIELVNRRGRVRLQPFAAPIMLWGYLQYRSVGRYRVERGGGGPGLSVPPERLCTGGPYSVVRNPMYLGHLIYLAGVALTLKSRLAALVLLAHVPWFERRVDSDEARLDKLFGADYAAYKARVGRWLPRLFKGRGRA